MIVLMFLTWVLLGYAVTIYWFDKFGLSRSDILKLLCSFSVFNHAATWVCGPLLFFVGLHICYRKEKL